MKKILLVVAMVVSTLAASAQRNDSSIGFHVNHTGNTSSLGLGANLRIGFTKTIRGEAAFNLFFPKGGSFWNANANAHYTLPIGHIFKVYPLAGLAYWNGGYLKSGKLGLNVGGGFDVKLDKQWSAKMEFCHQVASKFSGSLLSAGVNRKF